MKVFKNIVYWMIGIVVFGGLLVWSDWHPLNMIFGPEYNFRYIGKVVKSVLYSQAPSRNNNHNSQNSKMEELRKRVFWWRADYADLLAAIRSKDGMTAPVSYQTGPAGTEISNLLLRVTDNGLVLEADLPPAAISHSGKDGKLHTTPGKRHRFVFRDRNLNGWPDELKTDVGFPPASSRVTPDGFIRIDFNDPAYNGVILQWGILMATATNVLLRGVPTIYQLPAKAN